MKEGGQTMNGLNRKTGLRNQCYRCDSEYHLAPRCPWSHTSRGTGSTFFPVRVRPQRPSYSSISMELTVLPQEADSVGESETGSTCEQFFVTTVVAGDACMVSQEDSVVVLGAGATANLVCFGWLAHHNRDLDRRGIPRVTTYPSQARFRFGDGGLGEVRHAADTPVGIAGNQGMFRACSMQQTFQRYSVRAPWRLLVDSWVFRTAR